MITQKKDAGIDDGISTIIEKKLEIYFKALKGNMDNNDLYHSVMGEVEKPLLKVVLKNTKNNKSEASKILGISRNTLIKKTCRTCNKMSYKFWGNNLFNNSVFRVIEKRLIWVLAIISFIACCVTYYVFSLSELTNIRSKYLVLVLNIDLFILLILIVIVAKKLAKIWVNRKYGNINAVKLHTRFVVLFSLLTITPAMFMAIFSGFMFNMGVQKWFNDKISTALSESTIIAQSYLEEHKKVISANVYAIAKDIAIDYAKLINNQPEFNKTLDKLAEKFSIDEALVFETTPEIIARSRLSFALQFTEISSTELEKSENDVVIRHDPKSDRVRALIKIEGIEAYLLVGRIIDPRVITRIAEVENAVSNYYEIENSQKKLQLYLVLMFMAVTFLLLMVAIWFAIIFASRIASPIGQLITASEQVRKGDLSVRVLASDDTDEISLLMDSFNRMTSKISIQQNKLLRASESMDARRRFIEDILSSLTSGVININEDLKIKVMNNYALDILDVGNSEEFINNNIKKYFSEIMPFVDDLKDEEYKEFQLKIVRKKSIYVLNTHIKSVVYFKNKKLAKAYIITFVDITDLLSAQKKAAWADVARRIAHEIRNPLTPIQLSAEQLKRKYLGQIKKDSNKFENCVETIIRQVSHIGNMVKEFSAFAKLPDPDMKNEDLIKIIKQHIEQYKNSNSKINFSLRKNGLDKLQFLCDAAQISQVLNNILQNSIDSVQETYVKDTNNGKILLSINISNDQIILLVKDNGKGFDLDNIDNLTEPYVTTKKKGTGLGLAIVKKIIEDHRGRINLEYNKHWNAIVRIVFLLT